MLCLSPVAIAVELEDMNVVSEAIEQCASVSRSEANTVVHSSKGRLLVTMIEPRAR
jgi:hypothetical protein